MAVHTHSNTTDGCLLPDSISSLLDVLGMPPAPLHDDDSLSNFRRQISSDRAAIDVLPAFQIDETKISIAAHLLMQRWNESKHICREWNRQKQGLQNPSRRRPNSNGANEIGESSGFRVETATRSDRHRRVHHSAILNLIFPLAMERRL